MTTSINEIERFQTDRGIDKKPYNIELESLNVIEELLEAHGYGDNKARDLSTAVYDAMIGIAEGSILDNYSHDDPVTYSEPLTEDNVDAFGDIIVFSVGAICKLGYNPEKVLLEIGKEINSRTGEMVNGKFIKYKTPEAMAKWYKADFSDCKL